MYQRNRWCATGVEGCHCQFGLGAIFVLYTRKTQNVKGCYVMRVCAYAFVHAERVHACMHDVMRDRSSFVSRRIRKPSHFQVLTLFHRAQVFM